MRQIKLIIFDLDGTLVNAYAAVASSINFTLKKMGFPVRDSYTIRRAVGWGDLRLLKSFVDPECLDQAINIYRKHHALALKKWTRFLPGAHDLIVNLKKRKYKLAIASNRPTRFTLIILRSLGIRKYFDYVLCADKLKAGKPHPEILFKILQKLNCKRSEALYIGDMTIDVQTARRARVKVVAVLTGSSTRQEIEVLHPWQIRKRISPLPALIQQLNKDSY